MMNATDYKMIITDLKKLVNQTKITQQIAIANHENHVRNFSTFRLHIHYTAKQSDGLYFQDIILEGFENAMMLYNQYKTIGRDLKLHLILLELVDSKKTKVKKCSFIY